MVVYLGLVVDSDGLVHESGGDLLVSPGALLEFEGDNGCLPWTRPGLPRRPARLPGSHWLSTPDSIGTPADSCTSRGESCSSPRESCASPRETMVVYLGLV